MKRRHANTILTTLAAAGGAIIAYSLPLPSIAPLLLSTGVTKLLPDLPPISVTADVIILCVGAFAGAAVAMLLLPKGSTPPRSRTGRRFRLLRIGFLNRETHEDEPETVADAEHFHGDDLPAIRRSDAHPDAPPRPPVFASRDLGEQIWSATDVGTFPPDVDAIQDADGVVSSRDEEVSMPRAPEPLPWDAIEREMKRLVVAVEDAIPVHHDADDSESDHRLLEELSVRELTERLEQGLKRLKAVDRERPSPREEIADAARAEMKALEQKPTSSQAWTAAEEPGDLEEALAALRRITARAG